MPAPPLARASVLAGVVLFVGGEAVAEPDRGQRFEGRLHLEARGEPSLRSARSRTPSPSVPVLIQSTDPVGLTTTLRALHGHVGVVAGDVLTAEVPRASLAALGADPRVVRVELARRLGPRLDRVREVLEVDPIHTGLEPLAGPYTGRGVLIGAVDLTLDLTHRAFFTGNRSRVVALWDQDGAGNPPPGYDYGRLCGASDIGAGRCPHEAYIDHGTAVLAIAGGSRVGTSPYYGVAPGASLAFVNLGGLATTELGFNEWLTSSLCDGVAYLFSLADARGEPAVVNLSLGTHAGPHDGSSLGERCLDNLVGPGRIVVAAAGNEGTAGLHFLTEELVWVHAAGSAATNPERVSFLLGERVTSGEEVQVWFEGEQAAASIRVGVRSAAGTELLSAPFLTTDEVTELPLTLEGVALGPVYLVADQAPSGDRAFELVIFDDDEDGAENEVTWFVELADTGDFDAYLDITSGGGFLARDHTPAVVVDGQKSVGFPGTAAGVIAVGSTVSRVRWRALDGTLRETYDYVTGESVAVGELSTFSSRGPTRDPTRTGTKPDCVAPGEMVVSALPAAVVADTPPEVVVTESPAHYAVGAGTSESSPAAAGVVALLLERDPSLTPARIREILRTTSTVPAGVTAPSPDWGVGAIDAWAALLATPEVVSGDPPPGLVTPPDDGCGCTLVGAPLPPGAGWLALAGLVGAALARGRARTARIAAGVGRIIARRRGGG